jgi:ATP-dependent helicase/nuclease subunit B
VQLPLYASFALDPQDGATGGLVFAKVRKGECKFEGKARAARETIRSKLSGNIVNKPLAPEDMAGWRQKIVQLAEDFLAGRADVNPRDYPETCRLCKLDALCRIREMREIPADSEDGEEACDE